MGRRMLGLWGLGLFLASVTTASESQTETKEEVKWSAFEHVGEADFKKAMEERPYNLVAFVEPKNFESEMLEWEWPAIKEKEPNVLSVDCSVETDLCLEHDVRHYPTVRTYRTGKMYARYRGPRKAESILGFARRSTTSIVAGLTGENATSFAASDDVTFIMHLRTDDAGKGLYKRYHDLALEFRDRWSFGIVSRSDESSVDEEGEDAPTVLRCYNNAQDVQKTLDKFFDDTVGLRNFVLDCGRNLVQPLNKLNAKGYTEGDKPVLYYFDSEVPKREAFSDKIRPVAKKYADQIQVVTVDPLTFPEVVNQMMLKWQFPSMAIQVPADKRISLYDHDDIDEEIVEKFIRDILQMDQPVEYTEEVPDDEGIVMEDEEKVKVEAEGTTEEKHDEL